MTEFSGADDSCDFDGNTVLFQCDDNEYVYFSGLQICKFKTDDKIIDNISLMDNSMIPFVVILEENIHSSYTIVKNLLKTIKLKKVLY